MGGRGVDYFAPFSPAVNLFVTFLVICKLNTLIIFEMSKRNTQICNENPQVQQLVIISLCCYGNQNNMHCQCQPAMSSVV